MQKLKDIWRVLLVCLLSVVLGITIGLIFDSFLMLSDKDVGGLPFSFLLSAIFTVIIYFILTLVWPKGKNGPF